MNIAHTDFHAICAHARDRHLTLIQGGKDAEIEKRRKQILNLIQGYENDIALTRMAIAKLYEDLAKLDRRHG